MYPLKIADGKNSTVWQVLPQNLRVFNCDQDTKKLITGELVQVDSYVQTNSDASAEDVNSRARSGLSWDCDCGFGIFGKRADVIFVFNELKTYISSVKNDSFFIDDLMEVGAFTQLALMCATDNQYAVIQGGAYLQEFDPEFEQWLEAFQNVQVLWAGANYGMLDDGSPFEEYQYLMKPLHPEIEVDFEDDDDEEDYLAELEYAREAYSNIQSANPEVCKTLEAMWSYIPKE